jgi:hypothetical protein
VNNGWSMRMMPLGEYPKSNEHNEQSTINWNERCRCVLDKREGRTRGNQSAHTCSLFKAGDETGRDETSHSTQTNLIDDPMNRKIPH